MNKIVIVGAVVATMFFAGACRADAQELNCAALDISHMTTTDIEHARALCQSQQPVVVANQITPDTVKEWASLGQDFAAAVTSTAKGLGETANQFLFTPLGMMIAFYFLWGKIGGILIGVPLLIASWVLYNVVCRRLTIDEIEYENVPILWGGFNIRKVKSVIYAREVVGNDMNPNWTWFFMLIPIFLIDAIILGCLIF